MSPVEPHLFVILGGTGDLARRKLLPALCRLSAQGELHERCAILGVARNADLTDERFRDWARDALREAGFSEGEIERHCNGSLFYHPVSQGTREDYGALAARIEALERERGLQGQRILYLALPPRAFPPAITGLGEAGLHDSPGWTRLVIEKPFGRDLESAEELNALVHKYFEEPQIYRIDHYLGKETVQNLLVFRFANAIFESLWNRDHIKSVQITVAEDLGVEERAGYYDQAGALRDMVQNHLTQLLTLIAMEVPTAFEADAIRYEKIKVLRSIAPLSPGDAVFGQYAPGYLEEPGVRADSSTETYVALRLAIDSWRWQGVPFYLRTGKRLARKLTQIVVTFREPPICFFHPLDGCEPHSNVLAITLQPDEGFALCFEVKRPGEPFDLDTQTLGFRYAEAFGPLPDAYQTLLLDVMKGDQTLFVHADEVEASWKLYRPLLERERRVHPYPAGSWGPPQADALPEEQRWQVL